MSAAHRKEFRWRRRSDEEIPDAVDVVIISDEFAGTIITAKTDEGYLWGHDGALDWDLVRWWSHIPPPPVTEEAACG